ncbi:MAG TPA: 16S rRNA (guanine(527)-N(7))-methyltransferase RsmG [Dehalococcoidales bacterium]|nr:16S rRNA (guanine(527)-N(7))-methyltransferase RsmG [Dehalococcoidales bacterium]
MDKLQAGALTLGITLTPSQIEQFELYYRELTDWNQKINLTSITDHNEVQVKHFLDSLTLASAIKATYNPGVIDIGTGAGLPGIPLILAFPGIKLTLLEATAKKTKFLEYIVSKLGLNGVTIITGRAEEVAHKEEYREKYDFALARAVASLPALVEIALPFCVTGGRFVAQKKGDISQEIESSRKALDVIGGKLIEIKPISIEGLHDNRVLVIIEKIRSTPPNYPRRPGMPEKRPL